MAKDLIAKYGEGTGIKESELRKSLEVRNRLIVGGVLGVLVLVGLLYLLDPTAPLWALGIIGVTGGIAGLVLGVNWLIENLPTHLDNIKVAKKYGVRDDG